MRHLLLIAALAAPAPLAAQFVEEIPETEDSDPSLVEEGARTFLRGLMEEAAPAIDDLQGLADDVRPALREFALAMGEGFADLMSAIDDIAYYESPVILDNGDILIRRSPDAPDYIPPDLRRDDEGTAEPEPGDEIDL